MNATAVLICGQTRTFKHCYPTQREAVFRKLNNPHFFVSVAQDEQAQQIDLLKADFPHVYVEHVTQPDLDEVSAERYLKASAHAPWGISVPVVGIYRQAWALKRCWDFFNLVTDDQVGESEVEFTDFVRIRPDLHVHNFTLPTPRQPEELVFAPWWGSWGGIPDRLAFIHGHLAAEAYFTMFDQIEKMLTLGCAFHPETMLARALELGKIPMRQTLDAEFTTIRMPDDKRPHDKPSYSNRDVFRYVTERLAEAGL